ncbi:MAG: hypothetical protein M0Q49_02250 [Porticoccaceae bacterium]|nr:hypothetical protein [Porticoccaceae bacterium]
MAAGDITFFDQWLVDVQEGLHDHENDTFKLGLITTATTPTGATSDPRWGAGGGTNLSSNQVTPGGNYSSGGPTIANPTVTLSGGAGVWDGDDISILQDANNPAGARWGIIYNDTDAGKRAVGFVDLGADIDLAAGDFSITWNASGISTLSKAA